MSRTQRAPARVGPAAATLLSILVWCVVMLFWAAAPPAVVAATPSLTLVSDARYDVLPDEGRVAVSVDIVATNHLIDTAANRYFFEQAYLAVPAGASDFRVSASGAPPHVSVAATEPTHTLLLVRFGARLAAGASVTLHLEFNLLDPGAPAGRDVRVSNTIVTFSAWALASDETPGSSVVVSMPAGYDVTFVRGSLAGPVPDATGRETWASGPLDTPTAFEVAIRATRAAAYIESNRSASVGSATARVLFRAWKDDRGWLDQASQLVLAGVPAMAAAIGRPWPLGRPLVVEEGLVGEASESAGRFDPRQPRIEIAYYAGPEVVLHELAHTWFNGSRLADRWANEAFASLYAQLAAEALGVPILSPELTDPLRASRIPLNAWGPASDAGAAADGYGYAASLALARAIFDRAGAAGLSAVWAAIDAGDGAYPGAGDSSGGAGGTAGSAAGSADWRSLLDLLEERTSATYFDLWLAYVVRPEDAALLNARADAREAYQALVAVAGDWPIPTTIRDAMRSWRFDVAEAAIGAARTILADRDQLRAAAAAAGVELPPTLSAHFGAGQLDTSAAELGAARASLAEIVAAGARRPVKVEPLEWLGLLGSDPERGLATAQAAFAAGNLAAAYDGAVDAEAAWRTAADVARGRIMGLLVGLLAAILLVRLIAQRAWARRVGWS